MTISELESLMEKLRVGMAFMGDVEFALASKLFTAAREYRDAAKEVRDGKVNPDSRLAR